MFIKTFQKCFSFLFQELECLWYFAIYLVLYPYTVLQANCRAWLKSRDYFSCCPSFLAHILESQMSNE
jgi:hypothetical protein